MGGRAVLDKLIAVGEEDTGPAPQRAVVIPSLRPYLPSRRHLRRILGGLVVLVRMAWKVSWAVLGRATAPPKPKKQVKVPEKPKATKSAEDVKADEKKDGQKSDGQKSDALDALERAGVALLIVAVVGASASGVVAALWDRIRPYAPVVTSVAVTGLLVAAWIVGPDKPRKTKAPGESEPAAGAEAQPEPDPLPQAVEPLTAAAVVTTVRQIAAGRGWLGAHLDDVLANLPGRSRAELLEALAAAGIPVTEQLKLRLPGGRQRNRQGVRLAHLPAAPAQPAAEAAPEAPAEAAPEPAPPTAPLTVYGAG